MLDERNTTSDVYADRGYPNAQRSEMLGALRYREQIQRKGHACQPLSDCQRRRNQRIAKTRARVEHPFAQMRQMGRKFVRTIGQAPATVAMMAACYNLERPAKFRDEGWMRFTRNRRSQNPSCACGGRVREKWGKSAPKRGPTFLKSEGFARKMRKPKNCSAP